MSRINPFTPNSPVSSGMFVGRLNAIRRLEACLFQTKAKRPAHFLVLGERGIGKSSLLNLVRPIAEGGIKALSGESFSFLVVDTDVDDTTTPVGLIEKIRLGLDDALARSEPSRQFLKDAWTFMQRIEAGGVKLSGDLHSETTELLLETFAYNLSEIAARISSENRGLFSTTYDGIVLLIDEADKASAALRLGAVLKALAERLERRGCRNVAIGLAGLPHLRKVLLESHPSSLRLFEECTLDRLNDAEVGQVIDMCLLEAGRLNPTATGIDKAARDFLTFLSEGYPHFIQQFGYSAFAADTNGTIEHIDVAAGALGKDGALELIGDRYYRDPFYGRIQSEGYRQVLLIMAGKDNDWITKEELKAKFSGKASTLNNAIHTLLEKEIILAKEGTIGTYRLQHRAFAWWLKLCTEEGSELSKAGVTTT
jgi:AAA ATPase domain